MFEECGSIDRAEVVYGRDGRSRVSLLCVVLRYSATCFKKVILICSNILHTLCTHCIVCMFSMVLT
jgi:hypothetical protein